ncbi:MAG TPA: hypothetical protein VIP82_02930 [Microbacterium sp.]|uniref:hypothetical protein n=1 Tax=Microbacterium sp. TaxID=51671 RepID=UPI002F939CAA
MNGTAGWTERASQVLLAGASGVVVVAPEAEQIDALCKTAAEQNALVILDQRWRANPVLTEARDAVSSLEGPISFAEIAVNVPTTEDVEKAIHETVQIAHYLMGAVEDLRVLHRQSRTVLLGGMVRNGAPLTITIAVGPAIDGPVRVRVVARFGGVHLSVPDPETAAPGLVTIVHTDGSTTLPSRWESAHRASWRRVVAAVESGDRPDDLRDFDEASQLLFTRASLA